MKSYLVIWRGDEATFMQSEVKIGITDPMQMMNSDWLEEASKSEGYSKSETEALIAGSYDLICVCEMPTIFYNQ